MKRFGDLQVIFCVYLIGLGWAADEICPVVCKDRCPWGEYVQLYLFKSGSTEPTLVEHPLLNATWTNSTATINILIHGFTDDLFGILTDLARAYATVRCEDALMMVWHHLCTFPCYSQAVHNLEAVACCVSDTMAVIRAALPHVSINLLGHSLGAHVAELASHKQLVSRYVGIDPANPLCCFKQGVATISVVYYHSNCNYFGLIECTGGTHVYFNNAVHQIGCGCDITCSHCIVIDYYEESIRYNKPIYALTVDKNVCEEFKNSSCNLRPNLEYSAIDVSEPKHHLLPRNSCFVTFTNAVQPYLKDKSFYKHRGWTAWWVYGTYLEPSHECAVSPALDPSIDCIFDAWTCTYLNSEWY